MNKQITFGISEHKHSDSIRTLEIFVDSVESRVDSFQIRARCCELGIRHKNYGEINVSKVLSLKKLLEDLKRANCGDASSRDRDFGGIGKALYKHLFPSKLREIFWENKDMFTHLSVISEETWIPWQFIKPYHGSEEDIYIAERYIFSRWWEGNPDDEINNSPKYLPINGTLSPLCLLVCAGKNLPFAISEQDFLKQFESKGIKIKLISPPIKSNFEDALQDGGFVGLHIIGHMDCDDNDFESPELELTERDRLRAMTITGELSNFGKECALIFLNTCRIIDRSSQYCLTGANGFVEAFLAAGVKAVVCSTWDILDEKAFNFARFFYEFLFDGDSIGVAVKKARMEIYDEREPTWLSYTFFGDPLGRLDTNSIKM